MKHEKKPDYPQESEFRLRDLLIRALVIAVVMICLCVVLGMLAISLEMAISHSNSGPAGSLYL